MADSPQPSVVAVRGVQLHYGSTQALAGIDLDIPAGRMVGLIGPDGVGKSSLLAVAGMLDLKMGGPSFQDFVVTHPEHSPHKSGSSTQEHSDHLHLKS